MGPAPSGLARVYRISDIMNSTPLHTDCGKTSLIDTLMTSMFGHIHTLDKRKFTAARLRGLQQNYRRFPIVFDDIGRHAFNNHGKDLIKDESMPLVDEIPGFILSMNTEPTAFLDEIVKRALMVYTTTALPPHDEQQRLRLQDSIHNIRSQLGTGLYRRYLAVMMEQLKSDVLPDDWLYDSSRTLSEIFAEGNGSLPPWCHPVTWLNYAEKRYDRVRNQLRDLLRSAAFARKVRRPRPRMGAGTGPCGRMGTPGHVWPPGIQLGQCAVHVDQHGCGQWRPDSPAQKEFGGFLGMSPSAALAMAPLSAQITLDVWPATG